VVDNLTVSYSQDAPPVLRNVSFEIPAETGVRSVGVVGRTGSGKSTLALSLFRILEAKDGRILIDGVDVAKIGLHDLRSRITIVPQVSLGFRF
jgi:ABC-type multidrug transport system fused ATPase/permease subunit